MKGSSSSPPPSLPCQQYLEYLDRKSLSSSSDRNHVYRTLIAMAIGLEDCRLTVQRAMRIKHHKPSNEHLRAECQRRYDVQRLRTVNFRAFKPNKGWTGRQMRAWLEKHPITDPNCIQFVTAQLVNGGHHHHNNDNNTNNTNNHNNGVSHPPHPPPPQQTQQQQPQFQQPSLTQAEELLMLQQRGRLAQTFLTMCSSKAQKTHHEAAAQAAAQTAAPILCDMFGSYCNIDDDNNNNNSRTDLPALGRAIFDNSREAASHYSASLGSSSMVHSTNSYDRSLMNLSQLSPVLMQQRQGSVSPQQQQQQEEEVISMITDNSNNNNSNSNNNNNNRHLQPPYHEQSVESAASSIMMMKMMTESQVKNLKLPDASGQKGVYTGQCVQLGSSCAPQPNGHGRMVYKHEIYEGEWKNGQKHGRGKLYNIGAAAAVSTASLESPPSSSSSLYGYEGDWKDNRRDGNGVERYSNGVMLQSQWSKNRPVGIGWYAFGADGCNNNNNNNNNCHQVQAMDGKCKDAKHVWSKDGSWYLGDWENGWQQGSGTRCYANGVHLTSCWNRDRPIGPGVYRFSNNVRVPCQDGVATEGHHEFPDGTTHDGQWRNGQPIPLLL